MIGYEELHQPLTVKTLIESLQTLPQEALIKISINDASFEKLLSVTNIIFNDQEVVLDIEQNDDDGSSRIEKC